MSVGGEKIRRAVRPVKHADFPLVRVSRTPVRRRARARCRTTVSGASSFSISPTRNARPAWPPNCPSVKVARLPRYSGTSSPPATVEIGAAPRRLERADASASAPAATRTGCQNGIAAPSSRACIGAPVRQIVGRRVKTQRRPGERDLEAGGAFDVAEQAIAEPEARARPSARRAARRRPSNRGGRGNPAPWSACRPRAPRWCAAGTGKSRRKPVETSPARNSGLATTWRR